MKQGVVSKCAKHIRDKRGWWRMKMIFDSSTPKVFVDKTTSPPGLQPPKTDLFLSKSLLMSRQRQQMIRKKQEKGNEGEWEGGVDWVRFCRKSLNISAHFNIANLRVFSFFFSPFYENVYKFINCLREVAESKLGLNYLIWLLTRF